MMFFLPHCVKSSKECIKVLISFKPHQFQRLRGVSRCGYVRGQYRGGAKMMNRKKPTHIYNPFNAKAIFIQSTRT